MSEAVYDVELAAHLDAAVARVEQTFRDFAPHLARELFDWLRALAPDGHVAGYFRHEHRFPMLLLPWWVSGAAGIREDGRFQADVVYSTVAGYLTVRLLDDTLDGNGPASSLLPASVVLQSEFQHAYAGHFAVDHPFWDLFRRQWYAAADFARDQHAARDFDRRVAHRLGPALIPIAAVAYRACRPDLLEEWKPSLDKLARLEQLLDDITDWLPDSERDAPNYLLALHADRAREGEPLVAWILRDGLAHAQDLARSWLAELESGARGLGSAGFASFLAGRGALLQEMRAETDPGLAELARLRAAFDPA